MVKYILDVEDIVDYTIEWVEVNMTTKVIEARLIRKTRGTPPIRAMIRYASIAFDYCVPTVTTWTESSSNGVEYTMGISAESLVGANLTRIFSPIIKAKSGRGGSRNVVSSICHGN